MGLKITTEIYTDAGASSEAYVNIEAINFEKGRGLSVKLNNYLNKEAKDLNPNDKIICRKLFASVFIQVENGSPEFENLVSTSIYALAYNKVKERLIENGLSVEDDL